MRKILFLLVFSFLIFGVFCKVAFAQVNSDNVGPELPDPSAGANVIEKNGFTGTAAVINSLRDVNHPDSPHNTAHGARVVLRVDVDANTAQAPSVAVNYANQLNNSSEFPDGTLIVLGVELNNLDQQGWNGARTGNTQNDLARAAKSYADLYNSFSQVIHQKGKYRVAPAPPDLYNAVYDPVFWVQVFSSNVNCGLVDTLVADVFDVRPATGVGTVNLETWKYLEEHVCTQKRLKVTHFEGWGTDPKASIKDQIDFLKNHSFPEGSVVQTATSLIVNNCAGFGGNTGGASAPVSPWLYWIPKFPDKVFKADGTEFDYINCKDTNTTTTKTYEVKDVPCNQTTDPEFHSLRPYPASPCKKEVSETALMCGNDLIVKHTFTATPTGVLGANCTRECIGNSCTFTCSGNSAQVSIDLKNAELPILGNT